MEKDKERVLINVAPVAGNCHDIVPEEIASDVLECARRGAAMVHLHVRARDGSLTADTALLEETLKLIRAQSDIIIEVSTGGISKLNIKERCAPAGLSLVEACSLNVGSTNLGGAAYVNAPDDVEYCARTLIEHHKIPEVETFEIGHTAAMAELMKKLDFVRPVLFSIVLGHPGECPATPQALSAMAQFIPEGAVWGITHAHRTDFGIIAQALGMGARTVRIGFEDSNWLDPDTRVDHNFPLVEKAANLIRAMDKEVMTPSQARDFLGIPQL
ncbi:MAG: 3-keto-5-aminohexanoate cleavage protein [Succinivibrio sp.]